MPPATIAAMAMKGTRMKPIAAVELPEPRMAFAESPVAAIPAAMPDQSAHGASGRALNLGDSSVTRHRN
ncbi:hypothetical protein D3C83_142100 [compost metagenome]